MPVPLEPYRRMLCDETAEEEQDRREVVEIKVLICVSSVVSREVTPAKCGVRCVRGAVETVSDAGKGGGGVVVLLPGGGAEKL